MRKLTMAAVLLSILILDLILFLNWQSTVFSRFGDWGHIPVLENIVPWIMWLVLGCLFLLSFLAASLFLLILNLRQQHHSPEEAEAIRIFWKEYGKSRKPGKHAKKKVQKKTKNEPTEAPEAEDPEHPEAPPVWKEEAFE